MSNFKVFEKFVVLCFSFLIIVSAVEANISAFLGWICAGIYYIFYVNAEKELGEKK